MEETKAISPEVRGLFDTIRSQAKEYEKAFKYIEIERIKLEQQRSAVEHMMDEIRNEVNYTTLKLNQKVQESLKFIESRTEKTIKIYDNLENIVDLRDSLTQLHTLVKKQVSEVENFLKLEIPKTIKEFDILLKSVKSKSELELDNILNNFRQKMEKYLEAETMKLDQKNAMKFKQIESRVAAFELKVNNVSDAYNNDFKELMDEFAGIRNKVTSVTYRGDEIYNDIRNRIGSQMEGMNQKREQLTQIIGELENDRQNYARLLELNKSSIGAVESSIYRLSSRILEYENQSGNFQKKQNLAFAFSVASLIGVLIILLLETGIF